MVANPQIPEMQTAPLTEDTREKKSLAYEPAVGYLAVPPPALVLFHGLRIFSLVPGVKTA